MSQADKSAWKPKSFHSIDELRAELGAIEAAHQGGTLSTAGGWSVGQNLEHCATFMQCAIDGFDMKIPIPFRVLGMLLKPIFTKPNGQMRPGIKTGPQLEPKPAVSFEDGFAKMSEVVGRLESGEQMTHNSPLLGKMTHEQWIAVQLNHCRMHFGFFNYNDAG